MVNEIPDLMYMYIHLYLFQGLKMLQAAIYLEEKVKELEGRGYSGSSLLWLNIGVVLCTTSSRQVWGWK